VIQKKKAVKRMKVVGQWMLFLGLLGVSVLLVRAGGKAVPRKRTVAFSYSTQINGIPSGTKSVELWLPVPKSNPYQQIKGVSVTTPHSYTFETGQYGNRFLHLRLSNPTTRSVPITMHFTATREEHKQANLAEPAVQPDKILDPAIAQWLKPDRLVPINATIIKWAKAVVDSAGATTQLQRARAIYNHVISTVKYDKTGTGWGRGDIYYACDTRRGNCTDFHAIFIGYCRAIGIPARFAIGFSLPTDRNKGELSGYHCWAECYVKGIGWIPVDASEAAKNPDKRAYFFGAHDENRVEFSTGRDLTLHPGQPQPLNYFIYPYLEIDGKSVPVDSKTFTYQNIGNTATQLR
jgi:transglutaminase-like putative cysteine protease